jgi:hypothetical protein
VAVEAADEDRMPRHEAVEERPRRLAAAGPVLVVPGAGADPRPERLRGGVGADAPREVLLARGRAQVGGEQLLAAALEVEVAVDEARHRQASFEVEANGPGAGEGEDLRVAAERGDALAADRERGGLRPRRVAGPDAAAVEDEGRRAVLRPSGALRAAAGAERGYGEREHDGAHAEVPPVRRMRGGVMIWPLASSTKSISRRQQP